MKALCRKTESIDKYGQCVVGSYASTVLQSSNDILSIILLVGLGSGGGFFLQQPVFKVRA